MPEKNAHSKRKSLLKKLLLLTLVPVILIAAAYLWIASQFEVYQVPNTAGMLPTLSEGDLVIVKKSGARIAHYGQLVAFASPEDHSQTLIMRLMAKPGDSLEYRQQSIWLNNQLISLKELSRDHDTITLEETIGTKGYQVQLQERFSPVYPDNQLELPDRQYFLMGDNRYRANDSRRFGPVLENLISGVVYGVLKKDGRWLDGNGI